MSTLARLGLFLAALAVVFGGSFAAGAALDSGDDPPEPGGHPHATPVTTP